MKPNERIKECLDLKSRPAANATGERLMTDFFNCSQARVSLACFAVALSALLFACLFVTPFTSAEEIAAQQVFASPDAAVSTLVTASKTDDIKALNSILGPEGEQVVS